MIKPFLNKCKGLFRTSINFVLQFYEQGIMFLNVMHKKERNDV